MYAYSCLVKGGTKYSVWFIRNSNIGPFRSNKSWVNTISADFSRIEEVNKGVNKGRPLSEDIRLVFAYIRGDEYRFIGCYREISSNISTKTICYERCSKTFPFERIEK